MYEKILILDNANYIKHNLKELKGIIERESPAVIPISDAAFLLLRSEGINCIDYHSFEYRNMYADVYDTARKWGMGWYRPGNRDISLSRSYSLGDIIEWSSIYFFSNFLRIYLSLSEIIKSTAPKEIILATADKDIDPREHLAALQSVDLTLLTNILSECLKDLPGPVTFRILKFPYPGAFGEKHIDILKSVAIFVNIILSKIMKLREIILRKRKKILFLDGFHHFYDIMRSSELKGVDKVHLQKVIGPSLLPRLYARGISVYALREGDRKLSWNLPDPDVVKGELKEFFSYQGKDLLAHIWPRLEWILRVYIPETVHPKLISTIRAVEKTRPDCIVTENDSTYQEKMLTLIGRELNIPTVVVQHGSTVCDNSHPGIMVHNFLPLISDVYKYEC